MKTRVFAFVCATLTLVSVNALADDAGQSSDVPLPTADLSAPIDDDAGSAIAADAAISDNVSADAGSATDPDAASNVATLDAAPEVVLTPPPSVITYAPPPVAPEPVKPPPAHSERRWHLGPEVGIGLPSGATFGLAFNPFVNWAQVDVALAWDYLAWGMKAGFKLDPLALLPNVPVGLFADGRLGFLNQGNVPGQNGLTVGYGYESILGGLRIGKASSGFRWNIEAGESHLSASTGNFNNFIQHQSGGVSGLTLSNPKVSGDIPSVETGFEILF
jgi:hypothetical protein